MSAWRVVPIRRTVVLAACVTLLSVLATLILVDRQLGRRTDQQAGTLGASLDLAAQHEAWRLEQELQRQQTALDAVAVSMLALVTTPASPQAPLAAAARLCDRVSFPDGVDEAGVVDVKTAEVLALAKLLEGDCTDPLWALNVEALDGPPFPPADEVIRLGQAAMLGADDAQHDATTLVAVHRQDVWVRLRFARGQGSRVAFVVFRPNALEAPPTVPGARMDSLVTLGGVAAGYIHGGPGLGMVPAAVRRIKAGQNRALQLPEVAEAAASRAVLAWLFPATWDDGSLVLAGRRFTLAANTPLPVDIVAVASAPRPTAQASLRWQLVVLLVLALLLQAAVGMFLTRKLAHALWHTAHQTRRAWLISHDDPDEPDDIQKAQRLVDATMDGTRDVVRAAYGQGDQFWSTGPLEALVALVKRALQATPKDPEPKMQPPGEDR